MDPIREQIDVMTRRHFFGRTGVSLGTAALAGLLAEDRAERTSPTRPTGPPGAHGDRRPARPAAFPAQGQAGDLPVHERRPVADGPVRLQAQDGRHVRQGPARLDPQGPAADHDDQRPVPVPGRAVEVQVRPARPGGHVGQRALPWTARLVDDIALVKTVWTEAINHDPAVTYICTGNQLPGRPSLGSWLSYGLGTMNHEPAGLRGDDGVVDRPQGSAQAIYNRLWGSGYLPSQAPGRGAALDGDPVLYLSNPPGVDAATRRRVARRAQPAQPAASSTSSPTPRPRPGSPSTRWPSGCRPRSPS